MKTNQIVANLFRILLALYLITGIAIALMAQEEKDEKKGQIHVVRIIDGDETVLDTVIDLRSDMPLHEALRDMDLDIEFEWEGMEDLDEKLAEVEEKMKNMQVKMICLDSIMKQEEITAIVTSEMDELGEKLKSMELWLEDSLKSLQSRLEILHEEEGLRELESLTDNIEIITDDEGGEKTVIITHSDDGGGGIKKKVRIIAGGTAAWVDEDHEHLLIDEDGEKDIVIVSGGKKDRIIVKKDSLSEDGNMEVIVSVSEDGEGCMKKTRIVIKGIDNDEVEKLNKKGMDLPSPGVSGTPELEELTFYPNPGDGNFILHFEGRPGEEVKVTIFDISGREVYSRKVSDFNGKFHEQIDISGEETGAYILKIVQRKDIVTRKIILE